MGLEHEHEHDNEHDFRNGLDRGFCRFSNRGRGRRRRTRTIGGGALKQVSALAKISRLGAGFWKGNLTTQLCIEPGNHLANLVLFLHAHGDSFASVQNRSVISTPEGVSNLMQ
jgi:hypothetical protein